ncbi:hypothetical protein MAH1_36870 [Sessilibacter sp. MAH1]
MTNACPNYQIEDWNQYANCHAQVTTFVQHEVYVECAQQLNGNVLDIGCATGKLVSYLMSNRNITSYTGIDLSISMVESTKNTISLFNCDNFNAVVGDIETYCDGTYDSAVSIMSYYSWTDPILKLKNIYALLKPGGKFVLATANQAINIAALLEHSRRELVRHPFWNIFKQHNESLAHNNTASFISMGDLARECLSVGFDVESCHQKFYLGGMNFLVLVKPQL